MHDCGLAGLEFGNRQNWDFGFQARSHGDMCCVSHKHIRAGWRRHQRLDVHPGAMGRSELTDFSANPSSRTFPPIRAHKLFHQSELWHFHGGWRSGRQSELRHFSRGGISGSSTSQSCVSRHSWRNTPPETDGLPSGKGSDMQRQNGEVHMTDDSCFRLHYHSRLLILAAAKFRAVSCMSQVAQGRPCMSSLDSPHRR